MWTIEYVSELTGNWEFLGTYRMYDHVKVTTSNLEEQGIEFLATEEKRGS